MLTLIIAWLAFGLVTAAWFLWRSRDARGVAIPETVGWLVLLTLLGPVWLLIFGMIVLRAYWPRRFY